MNPLAFTANQTPGVKILYSQEDNSVNFVFPNGQEARYVRRSNDYFIVYVSSHGGCDQACRMCHLTQTKQTEMVAATTEEMMHQVAVVFAHYASGLNTGKIEPVKKIHINWMARGEPLLNESLLTDWNEITTRISYLAKDLAIKDLSFKISTIIPKFDAEFLLKKGFVTSGSYIAATLGALCHNKFKPELYYSMYSLNPEFRKRWLPKAAEVGGVLEDLSMGQWMAGMSGEGKFRLVLHWPYIEGENDSAEEATAIATFIKSCGLKAKFNLVRYNPYSEAQGRESSQEVLERNFKIIESAMTEPGSRIVPRVGKDIFASCGQFIETKKE